MTTSEGLDSPKSSSKAILNKFIREKGACIWMSWLSLHIELGFTHISVSFCLVNQKSKGCDFVKIN